MAANFRVDFSRQTERVIGATRVVEIFEIGFFSLPSEVYGQTSLDLSFWTRDEWQPTVSTLADTMEVVAGFPFVAYQDYLQDISKAGLLIDVMEVGVTSDDGKLSALIRQPFDTVNYHTLTIVPMISDLNARLNAAEAA